MFLSIYIFTMLMILTFLIKGDAPDELIISFFAFWGVEGGALAWIKKLETQKSKSKENDTK